MVVSHIHNVRRRFWLVLRLHMLNKGVAGLKKTLLDLSTSIFLLATLCLPLQSEAQF